MQKRLIRRNTTNAAATHPVHADGATGNSTGSVSGVSSKWASKFGGHSGTLVLAESSKLSETSGNKKHAGGRPSKYDPAYCDKVIELGKQGYSKTEMAVVLGVGRRALYDWEEQHDEFSLALELAMNASEAWWEKEARLGIQQPTKEFNAGLFGKIMSARFPATYREVVRSELTGLDGKPIPVAVASVPITGENLALYYKQFVDRATRPKISNATPV